ncbi:hypothetical protein CB0940_12246 [Cercospora beticola]|uniref:Uncharacterized protein n=1 Tax=Cercospora beticola TaxID=122368 RepID=A0A2G5GQT8_CERBT|nr:hypothetical protein CB0940_12246 [Cercospora beticola]PIA82402.1 hypothetical protein CB0940_12246 [Cercospora beticola]WPB03939.1 hypothetical protein RHO25_008583 [Cercospora beticola]CAK1357272.1 unnamed protein product [Cercospora beticola]
MSDTEGNREEIDLLVEAFVRGEALQHHDFKDAIIDSLIHAVDTPDEQDTRWYPESATIDRAYRGTPESSPLQKLLVDMHFFHGRAEWLDGATNTDFFRDLAKELLQDRGDFVTRADRTRSQLAGCSYHSHGTENAYYSVVS